MTALIAVGADVNVQDEDGRTPLERADSEEVRRLLADGISAADKARILAEIADIRGELEAPQSTTAATQ